MSRTLLVAVVVAGLMPVATPAAERQCGLFSKDVTCPQTSPKSMVTFAPDRSEPDRIQNVQILASATPRGVVVRLQDPRAEPDRTQNVQVPASATPRGVVVQFQGPQAQQPIDCDMVRWVDSSQDPLIAKRPPTDVHHTMRVIEVPACPKPEPGRAPIR